MVRRGRGFMRGRVGLGVGGGGRFVAGVRLARLVITRAVVVGLVGAVGGGGWVGGGWGGGGGGGGGGGWGGVGGWGVGGGLEGAGVRAGPVYGLAGEAANVGVRLRIDGDPSLRQSAASRRPPYVVVKATIEEVRSQRTGRV